MIPKVIHYIWLGKSKPYSVIQTIRTWQRQAPDFQIKEWNELDFSGIKNNFFQYALENNDYAFASDYARLLILKKYGGVYMDTDMYLLSNPQKLLTNKQLVFGILNRNFIFSTSFIASIPHQEFIIKALNIYNNLEYEKGRMQPNTILLSPLMHNLYGFNNVDKTQFRKNNTVAAYNSNILLQPSFQAIAMHIGEKSWDKHSKHDQLRIKMRKHIKTQFEAGCFRIVNDIFRRII